MDPTVVIDGGGTGSRLAAYDIAGQKLAQVNSTPASLSMGAEAVLHAITSGIHSLTKDIDKPADWFPQQLWCGLAGSQQIANREQLLANLPAGTDCHIINDGLAQLLGSTMGKAPAACLAIGTGSVLNIIDKNTKHSIQGGWGFPVGDEGGGAWIGLRAVNRLTHWYDTRLRSASPPPMIEAMLDVIEPTPAGIQRFSTCKDPKTLAQLAPLVFETAPQDYRAIGIIREGTEHLQNLIAEISPSIPLFVGGGLAKPYQPYLEAQIKQHINISPANAGVDGLYWYACNSAVRQTEHAIANS